MGAESAFKICFVFLYRLAKDGFNLSAILTPGVNCVKVVCVFILLVVSFHKITIDHHWFCEWCEQPSAIFYL